MKFSVIIPAHNEEQYLLKTLEAILGQDHKEFEVIVVDNNSTDKTYDIANNFASQLQSSGKLRVPITVLQEVQQGTMAACERGRSVATGDIIARLDADCRPDADWLSKAAKIFQDEKVVELSGPYSFYDASDSFNRSKIWQQKYLMGMLNTILQWLHLGATANEGNSFFRASTLESVGGFDKSIVFYGDGANIAKRLSKVGKIIFSRYLIMSTSARRFHGEGQTKLQVKYVYHFLKETFNRKNVMSKPN